MAVVEEANCAYKKPENAPWTHPSHVNRFRHERLSIRSGRHGRVGTHYRLRRVISGTRSGAGVMDGVRRSE